jgi:hypothetical protein
MRTRAAAAAKPEPSPMGTNSTSGGASFSALKNSTYAVDTPRTSSRWNEGTRCSAVALGQQGRVLRRRLEIVAMLHQRDAQRAHRGILLGELPCGTTMVAASPWRRAAKPTDWPWLPRVALMAWRTSGCSRAKVSK